MADEYAKFVRLPVTNVTNATGVSADITLPSGITVPSGYINFYVGLGEYECGLSTIGNKWGWFANSTTNQKEGGKYDLYDHGETHNISLQLLQDSGSNYKLKFYIDGVHKHSSFITYSSTAKFNNARLVIACAQGTASSPLPAFNIRHNQVTIKNMKYRTGTSTWTNVNSNNCNPQIWHTPENVTTPAPVDYTVNKNSFDSGIYYASIKG